MNNGMMLGKYYPAASLVHSAKPELKILISALVVVYALFIKDIYTFLLASLFTGAIIALSKVPLKIVFSNLRMFIILIFVTFVMNAFLVPQEGPGVDIFGLPVSYKALSGAFLAFSKIILLVVSTTMLLYTTTFREISDGLDFALRPLKKLGVPVNRISFMLSVSLMFIPVIFEEISIITDAQSSRGLDFRTRNLKKRMLNMLAVIIPLISNSIKRAERLAETMEARCFDGEKAYKKKVVFGFTDYAVLLFAVLYTVLYFVI